VPWRWDFYAQHRREVDRPRSWLAPLYRLYWSVGMDVVFHWTVIAMARWLPLSLCKAYYRLIMPAFVPRGWKVVDRSDRQLSMGHVRNWQPLSSSSRGCCGTLGARRWRYQSLSANWRA
jgi:hypothetical protein